MNRTTTTNTKVSDIQANQKWALNGGPFGSKLGRKDYVQSGVPVIRGANLPENSRFGLDDFVFVSEEKADSLLANNAHPGDIIFTQRGTLGQVGLIPESCKYDRFVISQSQMKLTVDPLKADPRFIYYYFRNPGTVKRIENHAVSSGVPHINLQTLRDFEIELPMLPTQRRIAGILSAYDDLIENNTRRIAILEEMARRIYDEWFVHFRYPGHENIPLVESELGLIPEGWEVGKLGELITLQRGFDLPTKVRNPGSVPVVAATGIVGFHDKWRVRGPGVVTGRSGSLGNVQHIESDFWPLNTTLWIREFFLSNPAHSFHLLKKLNLDSLNSGAAVPTLDRKNAHRLPVVCPPKEIIDRFGDLASLCLRTEASLQFTIDKAKTIRDLLLSRLMQS